MLKSWKFHCDFYFACGDSWQKLFFFLFCKMRVDYCAVHQILVSCPQKRSLRTTGPSSYAKPMRRLGVRKRDTKEKVHLFFGFSTYEQSWKPSVHGKNIHGYLVNLGGTACTKLFVFLYIIHRNQRPIWVSLMWILEKCNDITLKRSIANLGRSHRLPWGFINFHQFP